jgi:hypothetical protein
VILDVEWFATGTYGEEVFIARVPQVNMAGDLTENTPEDLRSRGINLAECSDEGVEYP